jgi:hypothetical protein
VEYKAITLPISGETVLVKPVSPFLMHKVRNSIPRPRPPMQRVNLGTPEQPKWEESPNEADPDYGQALKEWTHTVEAKSRALNIDLGARIEWTDEKRQAVAEIKAAGEAHGLTFEGESDTFIYVSYVAVKGAEDYNTLLRAILNESRPTEGAIQEAVATFRPEPNGQRTDLQGQEHL